MRQTNHKVNDSLIMEKYSTQSKFWSAMVMVKVMLVVTFTQSPVILDYGSIALSFHKWNLTANDSCVLRYIAQSRVQA